MNVYTFWLVGLLSVVLWTQSSCGRDLNNIVDDYQKAKNTYEQRLRQLEAAKQERIQAQTQLEAAKVTMAKKKAVLAQKLAAFEAAQELEKYGYLVDEPRSDYFAALQEKNASEQVLTRRVRALQDANETVKQVAQRVEDLYLRLQRLQTKKVKKQFALLKQQLEQVKTVEVTVKMGCDEEMSFKACRAYVKKEALRRAVERGSAVLVDAMSLASLQAGELRLTKDEIRTQVSGIVRSYQVLAEGFTPSGGYSYQLRAKVKGQVPIGLKQRFLKGGVTTTLPPDDVQELAGLSTELFLGEVWKEPVTGMEMVKIKGGCFQMGSPPSEKGHDSDERQHEVCVEDFWMATTEVTNAQYRQFNSGHDSEDYKGYSLNGDDQPVVQVSWHDAMDFVDWLNQQHKGQRTFRLPTEAEWEYAARAGTQTAYYWGDDPDEICEYGNVRDKSMRRAFDWSSGVSCEDGYAVTAPVKSFEPNNFGLYNMLGNVWEWTGSGYSSEYNGIESKILIKNNESGSYRVLRGGLLVLLRPVRPVC